MSYFNKNSLYSWLILLISLLVIFWQFGQIPAKLAFDEVEFAKLALSLEGKWQIFSPLATGHATPYFYLLLLAIKTFGLNVMALRLPAAIFAVLNSYLVWLLLQVYFPKKTAFLGTLVFTTSHWVMNFGRYSFEATYLLFWQLTTILTVKQFLKTKKLGFLALALFATIAAFYSYLPGRIFAILPILMLIIGKAKWQLIAGFMIIFTLFTIPLIQASGTYENRVQELSFLSQNAPLTTKISYFGENVLKNILMLNFQGDLNGRHNYPGKPALNPALGILFWLGFILSFRKIKNSWLFYVWLVLSILPSLFTLPQENPHFLRTYTLTVSLVFFITLALSSLNKIKPKWFIGLALLIMLSSVYELRTYFKYQPKVFKNAFEKNQADLNQLKVVDNLQKRSR